MGELTVSDFRKKIIFSHSYEIIRLMYYYQYGLELAVEKPVTGNKLE